MDDLTLGAEVGRPPGQVPQSADGRVHPGHARDGRRHLLNGHPVKDLLSDLDQDEVTGNHRDQGGEEGPRESLETQRMRQRGGR